MAKHRFVPLKHGSPAPLHNPLRSTEKLLTSKDVFYSSTAYPVPSTHLFKIALTRYLEQQTDLFLYLAPSRNSRPTHSDRSSMRPPALQPACRPSPRPTAGLRPPPRPTASTTGLDYCNPRSGRVNTLTTHCTRTACASTARASSTSYFNGWHYNYN